ncbi:MAG: 30S ribosomal protein S3 [Kiritimatiellae bacterium]|nr:30S ribosomal protein S3 [Kiritimatiellia bacterium]
MGQKANPIGMRVTVTKAWRSRWFADRRMYGLFAVEDDRIRRWTLERFKDAAISEIEIERHGNLVRLTIHTARPGVVVGRRGSEDRREELRKLLAERTKRDVYVDVQEVHHPERNAQLVAEGIAAQLVRRVSFRRAMKRAADLAMEAGAEGIRIQVAGRLGGAELARTEGLRRGKVPLHTLRENIDYGFAEARTVAGQIGVKVWICNRTDDRTAPAGRKERAYAAHA